MAWKRSKGWNRSFFGRKGASLPERAVYLRTLSNLSYPAEVRGVLSLSRLDAALKEAPLTASQIEFAQHILSLRFSEVVNLSSGQNNLLFATQENGATYSELHMAAGERSVLRLSREIAHLKDALILIDEVEGGVASLGTAATHASVAETRSEKQSPDDCHLSQVLRPASLIKPPPVQQPTGAPGNPSHNWSCALWSVTSTHPCPRSQAGKKTC